MVCYLPLSYLGISEDGLSYGTSGFHLCANRFMGVLGDEADVSAYMRVIYLRVEGSVPQLSQLCAL